MPFTQLLVEHRNAVLIEYPFRNAYYEQISANIRLIFLLGYV